MTTKMRTCAILIALAGLFGATACLCPISDLLQPTPPGAPSNFDGYPPIETGPFTITDADWVLGIVWIKMFPGEACDHIYIENREGTVFDQVSVCGDRTLIIVGSRGEHSESQVIELPYEPPERGYQLLSIDNGVLSIGGEFHVGYTSFYFGAIDSTAILEFELHEDNYIVGRLYP